MTPAATAATSPQVQTAITAGLAQLASEQQSGGNWTYGYPQAATGASAYAFLNNGSYTTYKTVVDKAIAYLLAGASTATITVRDDGVNVCPAGSPLVAGVPTCTGVFWGGDSGEQTYTTGIVTSAIDSYGLIKGVNTVATTTGPLAGMTFLQIAQGITNLFAAAQSTASDAHLNSVGYYGGWQYYLPNNGGSADTSTTQWAVFSFIYDESLGAVTPASTKTLLQAYLNFAFQSSTGGVCYQPVSSGSSCSIGPTVSDAGGWLLSQQWVNPAPSNSHIPAVLAWLNTNWTSSPSGTWYGDFGQPYAMLAVYKGLESTIGVGNTSTITTFFTTNCGGNAPSTCNWYQDQEQYLVATQSGGTWPGYSYWTDPLSSAFYLTILGTAVIPVNTPPVSAIGTPVLSGLGIIILGSLLALFAMKKVRKAHT
jgi:hypothetical protein